MSSFFSGGAYVSYAVTGMVVWNAVVIISQSVATDGQTPVTIIGMLALVVAAVTTLLGLMVRRLSEDASAARKDATVAWTSAVEAWKAADASKEAMRDKLSTEADKARAFMTTMADSLREIAIGYQDMRQEQVSNRHSKALIVPGKEPA